MMDLWNSLKDLTVLERIAAIIFLPASVCGAAGGVAKAMREKRTLKVVFFELLGGVITANVLSPVISDLVPDKWHYTAFFLAGWGGIELVNLFYGWILHVLENRVRKEFKDI